MEARLLHAKASSDTRLAQLSDRSLLLFLLSIPHLDCEGRMNGSPPVVRSTVAMALTAARPEDWTVALVESYITEWVQTHDPDGSARPLVAWEIRNRTWVLEFHGFRKNQRTIRSWIAREPASIFPAAEEGDQLSLSQARPASETRKRGRQARLASEDSRTRDDSRSSTTESFLTQERVELCAHAHAEEPVEEPGEEPASSTVGREPAAGPAKAQRDRDELWDALVEELGEPATRSERNRRNGVVKELREAGATAAEIHERIDTYRRAWPHLVLRDTALVTNWTTLASLGQNGRAPSWESETPLEAYSEAAGG